MNITDFIFRCCLCQSSAAASCSPLPWVSSVLNVQTLMDRPAASDATMVMNYTGLPTGHVKSNRGILRATGQALWHSAKVTGMLHWDAGRDKTPVRLPGASEFLWGASRSPWQLARRASKVEPETLKMHTFSDFTLRYFGLIRRRLPFVGHSNGETVHRRKKSGQVRINSGQVDLSHSLPQGQADHLVFVAPRDDNSKLVVVVGGMRHSSWANHLLIRSDEGQCTLWNVNNHTAFLYLDKRSVESLGPVVQSQIWQIQY